MLIGLQLVVACAGGAAITLYFHTAWCPLVNEVIKTVPKQAGWNQGTFSWPGQNRATALAHNPLAALIVDLPLTGKAGQLSDVQVEFGATRWRIRSLLGYWDFPYTLGLFDLDPAYLRPAWDAWKPAFLVFAGLLAAIGIFCSWILLAAIGAPVAKLMSFFSDRDLTMLQSWKVCGAGLMPGAIFFTVAIMLYSWSRLNLIGLFLAAAIHLVVDAVYMMVAPCRVPKKAAATASVPPGNPFTGSSTDNDQRDS
jgi:hypothetical protein